MLRRQQKRLPSPLRDRLPGVLCRYNNRGPLLIAESDRENARPGRPLRERGTTRTKLLVGLHGRTPPSAAATSSSVLQSVLLTPAAIAGEHRSVRDLRGTSRSGRGRSALVRPRRTRMSPRRCPIELARRAVSRIHRTAIRRAKRWLLDRGSTTASHNHRERHTIRISLRRGALYSSESGHYPRPRPARARGLARPRRRRCPPNPTRPRRRAPPRRVRHSCWKSRL
jgi:hypothetical protein